MSDDVEEAARLIAASGFNQTQLAERLTMRLGRKVEGYMLSRIVSGARKRVEADLMDALRAIAAGDDSLAPLPREPVSQNVFPHRLTESSATIPLYGAVGVATGLRLGGGNMVGVVPVHPAQLGGVDPFAFVVPDNRLADRLMRGEIAYVLRGRHAMPGQMCLVEMADGSALPWIYVREDEQTLFVSQKQPKAENKPIALRDIAAVYPIVSVTFGPA